MRDAAGGRREPFGLSILRRLHALPPDYTAEKWRNSQRGRFRGPWGLAEAACGLAAAAFAIVEIAHLAGSWILVPMTAFIIAFVVLTGRNLRDRQGGMSRGA